MKPSTTLFAIHSMPPNWDKVYGSIRSSREAVLRDVVFDSFAILEDTNDLFSNGNGLEVAFPNTIT
ncbi:MAG: hypothetical protein ABGX31_05980 [bacterium]|jgi:hypothetical protein